MFGGVCARIRSNSTNIKVQVLWGPEEGVEFPEAGVIGVKLGSSVRRANALNYGHLSNLFLCSWDRISL